MLPCRADVKVEPNPEEVDVVKYVTLQELQVGFFLCFYSSRIRALRFSRFHAGFWHFSAGSRALGMTLVSVE